MTDKQLPSDTFAALDEAVRANDTQRAAELLRSNRELSSKLNDSAPGGSFGTTILLPAAQFQNREMIDLLISHGADVNQRSHWWAGSFGLLDFCEPSFAPFLIDRGAMVDAHSAARLGKLDTLQELIAANPELVHARGGDGQTPLHFASTVEIATYLLENGAEIDERCIDHESTPAQWMIRERHEVAQFLRSRGCETDILMSSAFGDVDRVRKYLDDDPSSIATDVSPRYFPMKNPKAGGIIYIWTLGSNKTAHAVAREFGHDDVFDLLMERTSEELKLSLACELGDEDTFNLLLARRPNLAQTLSKEEKKKLVDAAANDNADAVRLMLKAGWPVDARGNAGATALHFAAWLGNAASVRELLGRHAPIDVKEEEYNLTPLDWALHGERHSWRKDTGDYATVKALLEAAAAS